MEERKAIHLNADALRRGRATQNLSQRAISRMTDIRMGALISLEKGAPADRLTLGSLYKLADALCLEPSALLAGEAAQQAPQPDDVAVEAVLAQVGKAVNRDDIAWALQWDLERVNAALLALERRLEGSGQRLRRAKFGWFGLAAAGDVLNPEAAASIDRATFSEYGLTRSHARVLYRLAKDKCLKSAHSGQGAGISRNPAGELLRANLLGIGERGLAFTPDVAFSLCLEDVPVGEPRPFRPQDRNPRAPYSINRAASGRLSGRD